MRFFCEKSTCFIAFFVLVVTAGLLLKSASADTNVPMNEKIPAVFVFGDSSVDTGNNNEINTVARGNYPPFGRDFEGGKPTGRFGNGKVFSDFVADMFGVKKLLPPYLDQNLQLEDLLTGVCFASGGSGYDPQTAKSLSTLSLSDQLDLFKGYITKIRSAVGEEKAATILSKSIYILCTGSDDLAVNYFASTKRFTSDINSYTDLMLNSGKSFFQELYDLGARRIGVVSLPAVGCLPSQRYLFGGIQRDCYEPMNEAATLFNTKISSAMQSLNKKLPDFRLVYLDVYSVLLSFIQSPAQYGFGVADRGCCGAEHIKIDIMCTRFDAPFSCKDASKYVFWDSFHPCEKAYQDIVLLLFNNTMNKFF